MLELALYNMIRYSLMNGMDHHKVLSITAQALESFPSVDEEENPSLFSYTAQQLRILDKTLADEEAMY
jgi:hypothetical protein